MFRATLCPSSGAHGDIFGYHVGRLVLELLQQLQNQTAYVVTDAIIMSS